MLLGCVFSFAYLDNYCQPMSLFMSTHCLKTNIQILNTPHTSVVFHITLKDTNFLTFGEVTIALGAAEVLLVPVQVESIDAGLQETNSNDC